MVDGLKASGRASSRTRGWIGEDVVELAEAGVPERLEFSEHGARPPDLLGISAHETLSTAALFAHEPGSFQHGDVLLYGGETHVVVRCECADRGFTRECSTNDVTPCRVGERSKESIHLAVRHLRIYNHMVVD